MVSTDPNIWIMAFFTIAITSLAFRDNPLAKFAEHTFLAAQAGNLVTMGFRNINNISLQPLTQGAIIMIIPILLGIALYTRYTPRYLWVSRYPTALMVGIGTGVTVRGFIEFQFTQQIIDTFRPLNSFNNIFFVVAVIICLLYFVFALTPEVPAIQKPMSYISTAARYLMMIALGAAMANTLTQRVGQYAGRVMFLLYDWLGLG
jgi:uncharacterized membrane protein YidH (DUF202 family)